MLSPDCVVSLTVPSGQCNTPRILAKSYLVFHYINVLEVISCLQGLVLDSSFI